VPVQYNINYPRLQLPKPLLDSFKAIAGKSFSLIHNLNQQNQRLAEARELLFPRLMNGELKF